MGMNSIFKINYQDMVKYMEKVKDKPERYQVFLDIKNYILEHNHGDENVSNELFDSLIEQMIKETNESIKSMKLRRSILTSYSRKHTNELIAALSIID